MWFTSRIGSKTVGHPIRPIRSVPRLEVLEDRTLPSTLTVLNNLDSGAGSLRAVITNAKSGDTIVFAPSLNGQTITLTSDQLEINKSLDIEGPGASLLTISGNDANRVFDISEGLTVTITGLMISHGRAGESGGGGVLNAGSTLTVADDIFSSNHALVNSTSAIDGGGAICNRNGATLTVTQSSFNGNQALGNGRGSSAYGGAILNEGSVATVLSSTFVANRVVGGDGGEVAGNNNFVGLAVGGGIKNSGGGLLTVEQSTFRDNEAIAGNGGSGGKGAALYLVDNGAGGGIAGSDDTTSFVSDCTFAYNQAIGGSYATGGTSGQGRLGNANGGGLFNDHLTTVTGCTFDHNEAIAGNYNGGGNGLILFGRAAGGGIGSYVTFSAVSLTVSDCTFTDNRAVGGVGDASGLFSGAGTGGGLSNSFGATAIVRNSIFSGNQAIGGQSLPGATAPDGLGGGIANSLGGALVVTNCTLCNNQVLGGSAVSGSNGGNGLGGGIYNDGQSTLTVTGSTITDNAATGGAAGTGGRVGQGIGGGAYFASDGDVCLDLFTETNIYGNSASTSDNDVFGVFTTC